MRAYKRRIHLDHHRTGKLRWCPCVGRRLNHTRCRIYTNRRWGVKVTLHVSSFWRDLMTSEPWMALESTAEGFNHYRAAQIRVAKAMSKLYTPRFNAKIMGVATGVTKP